jgi:hypothetical protein
MRKSERLRLLELHMVRLEMMVELYSQSLTNLLESQGLKAPTELDAGKWYKAKLDKLDNE